MYFILSMNYPPFVHLISIEQRITMYLLSRVRWISLWYGWVHGKPKESGQSVMTYMFTWFKCEVKYLAVSLLRYHRVHTCCMHACMWKLANNPSAWGFSLHKLILFFLFCFWKDNVWGKKKYKSVFQGGLVALKKKKDLISHSLLTVENYMMDE